MSTSKVKPLQVHLIPTSGYRSVVDSEELTRQFSNENITCYNSVCLEQFTQKVSEIFSDFLQSKRKPTPYLYGLSFILLHFTKLMHEDFCLANRLNECFLFGSFDEGKDTFEQYGYRFQVERSKSKSIQYRFNEQKVSHQILLSCLDYLDECQLIRLEKGFSYRNSISNSLQQWSKGFAYLEPDNFYFSFYCSVQLLFEHMVSNSRKTEIASELVVVRTCTQQYSEGKDIKVWDNLNINSSDLKNQRIIRESKKFVKALSEMYFNTSLQLSSLNECSPEKKLLVFEKAKNKLAQNANVEDIISKKVDYLNSRFKYLDSLPSSAKSHPYRVFHYDYDYGELGWGRIYANKCGVDCLRNYLVPLITLDGSPTVTIDVKSCVPQMHILNRCKGIDNFQDFYTYENLISEVGEELGNMPREDMKLLVQCLVNNHQKNDARRAFSFPFRFDKENPYQHINQKNFDAIVKAMLKEKPYFKTLFYKPNEMKKIILRESNYFIKVMKILLKENIKFIYRFDALIVKVQDKEFVQSVFQKVSNQEWGKDICLSCE